ncbi:hypothetical protein ANO11243_097050 [Dothideomycetidae sp. 11243]|nr:hypothetical protein ANO11243_097050 [fungal sp. No.11243]
MPAVGSKYIVIDDDPEDELAMFDRSPEEDESSSLTKMTRSSTKSTGKTVSSKSSTEWQTVQKKPRKQKSKSDIARQ